MTPERLRSAPNGASKGGRRYERLCAQASGVGGDARVERDGYRFPVDVVNI